MGQECSTTTTEMDIDQPSTSGINSSTSTSGIQSSPSNSDIN